MIEVLVWLLISHGANNAVHKVDQFKTEASCQEAKIQIGSNGRNRCIQANIYIQAK